MTEQEKIELSEKVAELYGVEAFRWLDFGHSKFHIANDSGPCFDLAVENEIFIYPLGDRITVKSAVTENLEVYKNHPSKAAATRIAILKCLVRTKELEEIHLANMKEASNGDSGK